LNPKSQREQPTTEDGINLVAASGIILRVVADWVQNEYTEGSSIKNGRQAEVYHHADLSDPASEEVTSQG
jgi:hypothetical protein